jgi:LAS superfamily LD-carboxypeptidase LdcB
MSMKFNPAILTGRSEVELDVLLGTPYRVHQQVLSPLQGLMHKATAAGFDLQVVSAFRSFDDQLKIWNRKASGQRPVLDATGKPVDIFSISSLELVHCILRWSALPAASRHHWGTDIDVIDARRLPAGYQVQLVPQEVEAGGMFSLMHEWLDDNMEAFGFYRPYDRDRGGVSPERWHLSYYPLSSRFTDALQEAMIFDAWKDKQVELREVVEKNLSQLFHRFVRNVSPPPVE